MVWLSNFLIFASRSYGNTAMKHATCLRNCNAACLRKCSTRMVEAAKYVFDVMLLIDSTKHDTVIIVLSTELFYIKTNWGSRNKLFGIQAESTVALQKCTYNFLVAPKTFKKGLGP